MVSEEQLRQIVDTARDAFAVRRILLFGSCARGDAHEHSDINLCVVAAPDPEKSLEEWPSKSWLYRAAELIQRISGTGAAVDAHVFTEGEFEALRDREHPLIAQILEEGRVLYE